MKLSGAIRQGIPMTEGQAKAVFVSRGSRGEVTACALGTAMVGAGVPLPEDARYATPLPDGSGWLQGLDARLEESIFDYIQHPDGSFAEVHAVVSSLNDKRRWTREKIVAWLDERGL